ncbi:sulfotransferase family protein [Spongiactinospora gelatinilytica]|uniref:Sulfotransferase family protein n=1 Tax=Spongiactinospora gelatinilytica TaxID=2666298 RepID=A0A2W2HKU3_9ACTN|nr:sulfotransferase [Spongiactinospora gelatinilytica]PZG51000.1 sulfotransferase family protein [Spongiactinospora gelatinilytica]
MNWKRKVNETVGGLTGFRFSRVQGTAAAAAEHAAATLPARPATAADELVRPPADPEHDRLVAPVFVLSPVRSGSTLLRVILNAHTRIHAPHELHVRRLTVGFGTSLAEKAMDALGHNQADLEHLLWDRLLHRELVRSGKSVIVDKTPANAFAYKRLRTCWPGARFIFLLRHPVSIATSWHEAAPDRRDMDAASADALRYMKAVQRARTALTGLTVRYEDLTEDPARETRRICEFLDVEWEAGMLEYGGETRFVKGLGDWKDKIRSGAVQPGRELPRPEDVPAALKEICLAWGYAA